MEVNELSKNARGGTELMLEGLHKRVDPELLSKFQIIPTRVRNLDPDKKKIYWVHDLPTDPECNHLRFEESRNRFDRIVFASNWQFQQFRDFLGVPFDFKSVVIENAIEPIELHDKPDPNEQLNLVYFTTPHRGLELLYPAFEFLCEMVKPRKIHLHVFSSFSIYGWSDRDLLYQETFDKLKKHPNITYYGAVPNEQIREHLKKMHILAYPCIWPETSCIQLIEAMSAGLLCVHPNFAALPDTSGGMTMMYRWHQDPNKHASYFAGVLNTAVKIYNEPGIQSQIRLTALYANSRFNWRKQAAQWTAILGETL